MRRSAVLALFILLLSASVVRGEFYHWVDKEGKDYFTNDREKIPYEYRGGASLVKPDESRVSVEDKAAASGKSIARTKERKDKHGRGEEYWRKKASKLRTQLDDLQTEHENLMKHEKARQDKGVSEKDKDIASRDKKKLQLEKKIAIAKRKLEVDLPEEARRADAYPGWIRE